MKKTLLPILVVLLYSCYNFSGNTQTLDLSTIEIPDSISRTIVNTEINIKDTNLLFPFINVENEQTLDLKYFRHSCFSEVKDYRISIKKRDNNYFASFYIYKYPDTLKVINDKKQSIALSRVLINFSTECKTLYEKNGGASYKKPTGFISGEESLVITNGKEKVDMPLMGDNTGNYDLIEPLINEILGKNNIWRN